MKDYLKLLKDEKYLLDPPYLSCGRKCSRGYQLGDQVDEQVSEEMSISCDRKKINRLRNCELSESTGAQL